MELSRGIGAAKDLGLDLGGCFGGWGMRDGIFVVCWNIYHFDPAVVVVVVDAVAVGNSFSRWVLLQCMRTHLKRLFRKLFMCWLFLKSLRFRQLRPLVAYLHAQGNVR